MNYSADEIRKIRFIIKDLMKGSQVVSYLDEKPPTNEITEEISAFFFQTKKLMLLGATLSRKNLKMKVLIPENGRIHLVLFLEGNGIWKEKCSGVNELILRLHAWKTFNPSSYNPEYVKREWEADINILYAHK